MTFDCQEYEKSHTFKEFRSSIGCRAINKFLKRRISENRLSALIRACCRVTLVIAMLSRPFQTSSEAFKIRKQNRLLNCNYPYSLIVQLFHKAKLQGPAPYKTRDIIPLVTTFYLSLSHSHGIKTISNLFKGIQDPETKLAFKLQPALLFD